MEESKIYGECAKHPGNSMIDCPECSMENIKFQEVPKIDLKAFEEAIANMSKEDKEKYFPEDKTPKGWVSIEEHLPMVTCDDFLNHNAVVKFIKVKNAKGRIFNSQVGDHQMWYYDAKEAGITHWWNDDVEKIVYPRTEDIKVYVDLFTKNVKCSNPKCHKPLTNDEIVMHKEVGIVDVEDMACQGCWMRAAYGYI